MKKLILPFLLFFFGSQAYAQQTIFNVPSVEITQKNKTFLQHESQFRGENHGEFYNSANYFAHGIGNNTEIDVTQFNLSSPASQNISIGVGAKTVFELDKENPYQHKIMFGAMLPISLQGNGVGHWLYGAYSITLPQTNTRFTAGFSSGTKQMFSKNVNAFMGGIEQKITDKFSLIGDWYSGNQSWGLAAVGFSYALPKDFTIYAGRQITNSKRIARNSYVIEIATIF
jgi:hypothetical protein